MKITIIHPDLKQSQVRFSERQKTRVSTLYKRLPSGAIIKRLGRTFDISKECLLNKAFTHGDVIAAVYTPVVQTERLCTPGIRTRRLWKCVKRSTDQCMITLDTDVERAEMPCGHAITPQALYDYCCSELEKGSSTITCPYVTDIKGDKCGCKWKPRIVKHIARMSNKEHMLFYSKLDINRIKQQEIQSTNVFPDDVMISVLHNSPKLRGHGPNVRMHRACPKCWSVIEHNTGCLSMTCQYPSCNFRFCFRCLRGYEEEYYDHRTCLHAPLQFSSE